MGKGYTMHSNNSVVTVSLGTSRVFEVKNRTTGEKNCITLEHGDLVIMDGDFQDYNTHSILKDPTIEQWRLSLTFRHL
jgi:alkylated DNA repair dioxygenase AlkB